MTKDEYYGKIAYEADGGRDWEKSSGKAAYMSIAKAVREAPEWVEPRIEIARRFRVKAGMEEWQALELADIAIELGARAPKGDGK